MPADTTADAADQAGARLAEAVQAWLDFQILCGRGHLLSDASLAQPVGELLNQFSGTLQSEVTYEPIGRDDGRGRPRQLDYVIRSRDVGRITTAVEAKWVAASAPEPKRFLDDLLRLQAVRLGPKGGSADLFFLVAGTSTAVADAFQRRLNAGDGWVTMNDLFLPLDLGTELQVPTDDGAPPPLRKMTDGFRDDYPDAPLRRAFCVRLLTDRDDGKSRVLVWRVTNNRSQKTTAAKT